MAQNYRVLYAEDEASLQESVARYLKKFFADVDVAADGEEGLQLYKKKSYDLVITDILMPKLNGIEMLKKIKEIKSDQEVIVVSAYSDSSYFSEAIMLGVSGYILKPVNFSQMNEALSKVLSHLSLLEENRAYEMHLEMMIEERTREKLLLEGEKYNNFEKTLQSLVHMVEGRDTYTGGHSQRVADYSRAIAEEMGFSKDECMLIYRAGILHDLGKITTPDAVLLKPGKLNAIEYKLIQEHVEVSYALLTDIPMYHEMAEIIRHHHEHFDGSGYPQGLQAEEIPMLSHIMILADAFDAMTTNRIYKARMDVSRAIDELLRLSFKQFHPDVVKAATKALSEVKPPENVTQEPITELEQERFAYFYKDQVSALFNQDYLDFTLVGNTFTHEYNYLNLLFLHNFTQYNEKNGWNKGDELLKLFADYLKNNFTQAKVFRIHGDDFALISKEELSVQSEDISQKLNFDDIDVAVSCKTINLKETTIDNFAVLEAYIQRSNMVYKSKS